MLLFFGINRYFFLLHKATSISSDFCERGTKIMTEQGKQDNLLWVLRGMGFLDLVWLG